MKTKLGLENSAARKLDIFFFDTKKLELEKQGLALRLRNKQKKNGESVWEVTTKERPASSATIKNAKTGKLEKDRTVLKGDVVSYSLEDEPKASKASAAISGTNVKPLFGYALTFLGHRVDWNSVRCFPVIKGRRWTLPDKDIDVEQWDYAGKRVLEFSVKAENDKAAKKEKEFVAFLEQEHLNPKKSGGLKTSTALKELVKQFK